MVPAEGKVGGGGVVGNWLHGEGKRAVGTVVKRWWPHHNGWHEAIVDSYSRPNMTHMYAPACPVYLLLLCISLKLSSSLWKVLTHL